jgi:hypothetical protein
MNASLRATYVAVGRIAIAQIGAATGELASSPDRGQGTSRKRSGLDPWIRNGIRDALHV